MNIYINSKIVSLDKQMSLADILIQQGWEQGCFAVAINRTFVPRNQYTHIQPVEGDHIEIVTPMQGG